MQNNTVLGILGGLGPMATVYFYELVTAHTKAAKDQDHIDMVISSRASTPDRTAFIIGQSKEDPFAVMEAEAKRLVEFGAGVLAIPCNTAHYFYERLDDEISIPVLNMVEDTVHKAKALGAKKLGILATTGTVATGTYQRVCDAANIEWAIPDEDGQQKLMHLIYKEVKAGKRPDVKDFYSITGPLLDSGCDMIILGCTELSVLCKQCLPMGPLLDSMSVLAECAILACGRTPQNFHWPKLNS